MGEIDEFVTNNNEPNFLDPSAMSAAYQKMTMVCKNVKNEIYTDIEIQNQDILPRLVCEWKKTNIMIQLVFCLSFSK